MVLELVPRNLRLRTVRQATLYVRHCPLQLAPTKSETGTVLQATVRQTLLTLILSAILDCGRFERLQCTSNTVHFSLVCDFPEDLHGDKINDYGSGVEHLCDRYR